MKVVINENNIIIIVKKKKPTKRFSPPLILPFTYIGYYLTIVTFLSERKLRDGSL